MAAIRKWRRINPELARLGAVEQRANAAAPDVGQDIAVSAIAALVRLGGGRWVMPRSLVPPAPFSIDYHVNETEIVFTEGKKS